MNIGGKGLIEQKVGAIHGGHLKTLLLQLDLEKAQNVKRKMQNNSSKFKTNNNPMNVFNFKLLFYAFRFALFTFILCYPLM